MKNLNFKELAAYASAFVSFVLPKVDVEEIILFGSVARGEAGKESDIDLFFNTKNESKAEKIVEYELNKFYKSKIAEIFLLKGIKNKISVKIGKLDEWKLRRSIITDGIVLYGKYKEIPEKTRGFVLFNLKPVKNIAKRNKIIRLLFGRKEKGYEKRGLVDKFSGKKVSPASFIIPIEKEAEILKIINSEKIDFNFFEFWSDQV
ncbi:MAG: nucleotidyltransferase domain-containing protein [Nanoarchaeota archaeon]